tara:strand:- start:304 stop:594 length:291 start_codon:yes stop_codon:yes gene_type:complete
LKRLLVKLLAIGIIAFMSCNKEHNPLKDVRFQNVVEAFLFDRGTENEFSDFMDANGREIDLVQNDLIHQSKKMFKHNDFAVPRSVLILILIMVVLL